MGYKRACVSTSCNISKVFYEVVNKTELKLKKNEEWKTKNKIVI